jgi:phospholipid/cholesterol/gamma-HCH transport system substrate-binding protein
MRRSLAGLTVGALALVVIVTTYLLFQYTSKKIAGGQGYRVSALFHNALGVYDRTRVLSAGLRVGQVEDRELDQQSGKARVFIRILPGIRLYENAVIAKRSASLLGEYYLDVDPGTAVVMRGGQSIPQRELHDGDEVKNVSEPVDMGDIMNSVGETLPILKDILSDVRMMTSGPIKDLAKNADQLLERNSAVVERLLGRIDDIAATVQGITRSEADDVRVTLRNAREISESIKGLVGTTQGQVSGAGQDLRTSLQKLQSSIDNLDKSLRNVDKITGRMAEGEGTVGHLLTDDTVAKNLDSITDDVSTITRGVSRLQTIVGLRTEYNYMAHTFKSYVSIQLAPRPDKFYLIELVDDPRGYRTASSTVHYGSDDVYSAQEVTTTEKLRFSFMFGKRWGAFQGRFGIKESTGGVGGDLFLFDDRLSLSADIYDTRSNQYPRFTARAYLALYKKYLYLVGGVDDVFNRTRTQGYAGGYFDWFMGASLVFNDQDLKSLLLFGGAGAASAAGK